MTARYDASKWGELSTSEVVTEWAEKPRTLCNPEPPVTCDCGYVGDWELRSVMVWHDSPQHHVTDSAARSWMAKGWPVRYGGWWVYGGWDERCPACGDIERFDLDYNLVRRFAEQAKVVIFMDARR